MDEQEKNEKRQEELEDEYNLGHSYHCRRCGEVINNLEYRHHGFCSLCMEYKIWCAEQGEEE